jgi:hypothetical protein
MVAEHVFVQRKRAYELDSLVCLSTVAEITDAINHLDEHMAEFYSNKEISTEDNRSRHGRRRPDARALS